MTKKIFYEKVGRRYKPVYEYDYALLDALPKGNHLISVYPGGKSTRYNVEPNFAALIAAGRIAEDAMTRAVQEASEIRREENSETPLTNEQKEAWEQLVKVFGERARFLHWKSAHDVAEAGIAAMQAEAEKLMKYDTVKLAFEQFLMVCELTKEGDNV
jgi:hypothetical protein